MRRATFDTIIQNNVTRAKLFSSLVRHYSQQNNFLLSSEFTKEIQAKLDPIEQEFSGHRAVKHPLFDYLSDQAQEGFNARQFLIYRDNFFRRTHLTIPSIARTIAASAEFGDMHAASLYLENLRDEMGRENEDLIHSKLLLESHNIHGIRVFSIDPMPRLIDVKDSKFLLPEVEEYRKQKHEIFSMPYPFVAGNTWAHELAADKMLDNFKRAFFDPYIGYYKEPEWLNLTRFFTVHKDDSIHNGNVEEQHGEMARISAELLCKEGLSNLSAIKEGGLIFLSNQEKLWDGLLRELEKAKSITTTIKPKLRQQDDVPNTKITKPKIEKTHHENEEAIRK